MLDLRHSVRLVFYYRRTHIVRTGIFSPENKAALTDVNVNLYAGLAMLIFGASSCYWPEKPRDKARPSRAWTGSI